MIYRILVDTTREKRDPTTQTLREYPCLRGAFTGGVTEGFRDLPTPNITNRRARFYFTEAGWELFGRHVAADARQQARVVRVLRRKQPRPSQIVYQDAYQVAILPAAVRR